ncbi:hypothetical protein HW45_03710 [Vibrio sp. ER1A]|nr:hypothetical protein HW45_03710 [Vibrio sp. ER1A]
MDDALNDAYREFCDKSEYLTQKFELASVVSGTQNTLSAKSDHSIIKVDRVYAGGDRDNQLHTGDDYLMPEPDQITFNANASDITIECVITPDEIAELTEIDDKIAKLYGGVIADKAASILRMMPGEDWFNPEKAAIYEQSFVEGYRDAFRLKKEGFNSFHNRSQKHNFR